MPERQFTCGQPSGYCTCRHLEVGAELFSLCSVALFLKCVPRCGWMTYAVYEWWWMVPHHHVTTTHPLPTTHYLAPPHMNSANRNSTTTSTNSGHAILFKKIPKNLKHENTSVSYAEKYGSKLFTRARAKTKTLVFVLRTLLKKTSMVVHQQTTGVGGERVHF